MSMGKGGKRGESDPGIAGKDVRRRLVPWEIMVDDPLVDRFSRRDGHF